MAFLVEILKLLCDNSTAVIFLFYVPYKLRTCNVRQIQPHYLYSPSLSSGMTEGLIFASRSNLFAVPVPTLIVLGMSFSISTQSSDTHVI